MPSSSHGRALPAQQQHSRTSVARPGRVARRALTVLALAALLLASGAASASAITRDTVLMRGQTWIDDPVPYSQSRYYPPTGGGYRTDCSGYASMCWQTGTSWATATFDRVTHPITVDQLRPGDGLLKAHYPSGNHIRIFYGWYDDAHTRYIAYEQTGPETKSSIKTMATDLSNGYVPVRYDSIADSPPTNNILRNSTFDVWASQLPVWWTTASTVKPIIVRRQDAYRGARNSLELVNPTGDYRQYTELEQTASVTPETTYTLTAWARTKGAARSVEMRLRYLDWAGQPVTDIRTLGTAWALDDSAFKKMSMTAVAPQAAKVALVTMRVAGATDASGTAGNSVILDDVALTKPQTSITIQTAASSTYLGRTVTLSGAVTPTQTIGANAVVYVKKPGSYRWSYSSNRTVYALSGGAAWQYKYYFKPGMARGYYYYYAQAPALSGWMDSTSPMVSIRVQ